MEGWTIEGQYVRATAAAQLEAIFAQCYTRQASKRRASPAARSVPNCRMRSPIQIALPRPRTEAQLHAVLSGTSTLIVKLQLATHLPTPPLHMPDSTISKVLC